MKVGTSGWAILILTAILNLSLWILLNRPEKIPS